MDSVDLSSMSSACFKPEVSSSGRRMCVLLWYGTFYVHQYMQFSKQNSVLITEVPVKHTVPYLCVCVYI
jgi:hypothetical protein